MPIYEFKCKNQQCGNIYQDFRPLGDTVPRGSCPDCGSRFGRHFGLFAAGPVDTMDAHMNATTGTVIRSRKEFRNELKRKSDEMSERTGMTHNYVEHDAREMKQDLGVTDEGLESTYREVNDSGDTRLSKHLKREGLWL